MPIYEYKCDKCGRPFEKLQKMGDPPCRKCPNCGGALHKVVSSPAIQFKGKGFYITDYPKKGAAGEDKKSPSENAASDKAASDKKDGKKKDEAKPKAETLPADKPCPE